MPLSSPCKRVSNVTLVSTLMQFPHTPVASFHPTLCLLHHTDVNFRSFSWGPHLLPELSLVAKENNWPLSSFYNSPFQIADSQVSTHSCHSRIQNAPGSLCLSYRYLIAFTPTPLTAPLQPLKAPRAFIKAITPRCGCNTAWSQSKGRAVSFSPYPENQTGGLLWNHCIPSFLSWRIWDVSPSKGSHSCCRSGSAVAPALPFSTPGDRCFITAPTHPPHSATRASNQQCSAILRVLPPFSVYVLKHTL